MIAKCLGHSSSLAASASSKMTAILNQLSCSKTFAYAEQTGYAEYADYAEYAEYAEGVPNELCKDLKKTGTSNGNDCPSSVVYCGLSQLCRFLTLGSWV